MKLRIKMPESLKLAAQQLTGRHVGETTASAPASLSFLKRTAAPAFILFLRRTPAARWFTLAAIPVVVAAAVAPIRLPMIDIASLLLVLTSAYCVARAIWFLAGEAKT